MLLSRFLCCTVVAVSVVGCGIDKNSAEYDERRFKELQKAHCAEMASFLALPLITDNPQDENVVLKRCEVLKSLSFPEYKRLSDFARETGSWDVYEFYPEKRPVEMTEPTEVKK